MSPWREALASVLVGTGFGAVLSALGFSSWDALHGMLTLADPRLLATFGLAAVLLLVSWPLVLSRYVARAPAPRLVHPGTIVGGALFGAGWAISGACPAAVWVQLGELQLGALATVAGIALGNWLYPRVHARWFRWSKGSCVDE